MFSLRPRSDICYHRLTITTTAYLHDLIYVFDTVRWIHLAFVKMHPGGEGRMERKRWEERRERKRERRVGNDRLGRDEQKGQNESGGRGSEWVEKKRWEGWRGEGGRNGRDVKCGPVRLRGLGTYDKQTHRQLFKYVQDTPSRAFSATAVFCKYFNIKSAQSCRRRTEIFDCRKQKSANTWCVTHHSYGSWWRQ